MNNPKSTCKTCGGKGTVFYTRQWNDPCPDDCQGTRQAPEKPNCAACSGYSFGSHSPACVEYRKVEPVREDSKQDTEAQSDTISHICKYCGRSTMCPDDEDCPNKPSEPTKGFREDTDEVLKQLQYGTMMSDNQEPMLTNNRNLAISAIQDLVLQLIGEDTESKHDWNCSGSEGGWCDYPECYAMWDKGANALRQALRERVNNG